MIPGEKVGVRPRAGALLIDLFVLSFIQVVVLVLLQGIWIAGCNLLIWIAYSVHFDGRRGATVGKLFLGLRIVQTDGSSPGYRQAFIRCLVKLVPLLPLFLFPATRDALFQTPGPLGAGMAAFGLALLLFSAVFIARHPHHQALHDRVARTVVIRIF